KPTLIENDEEVELNVLDVDALGGRNLATGENSGLDVLNRSTDKIKQSDMIVIALGTNMLESEAEYEQGIRDAVSLIRSHNPSAVIAMPGLYGYKDGTRSMERREDRNQIIYKLSDELNIEVMDIDSEIDSPEERTQHMDNQQV